MTVEARSEWDTCKCGDYRRNHVDGIGQCGLRWLKPDCGCTGFRLEEEFASQAEAEETHNRRMKAARR
jgi:hypothetical protein